MISAILVGSAMRATPPSARMSAGTRSSAMTATAPASSAIFACSAVVTSMITPPLSISASPVLTRSVPVSMSMGTSRSILTREPHESRKAPRSRSLRPRPVYSWVPGPDRPAGVVRARGRRTDPASGGRHGEGRGEQLDPRVPRVELDLVPVLVHELRDVLERGPDPGPLDHPAVTEHVRLPGAGGHDLR